MKNQFQWRQFDVMYRETRSSNPEEEPRWIVNRETIQNLDTGETIRRGIIRHPGISVIVPFLDDDHIFFVRGLTLHAQSLDIGEVIDEIRSFSLAEIRGMIARGEIRDAKTLVGLFYALGMRYGERERPELSQTA